MSRPRLHGLDTLRGLAVVLMIVFHFVYDLWMFGYIEPWHRQGFWFMLPRFIVFLFLWCVGASLELVNGQGINWKSYNKRLAKILGLAFTISLVTFIAFPNNWIYFGTLHCIAAVSILALPFFYYKWARLPVLIMILIAQYGLGYGILWVGTLIPRQSMDFIPAYPWFWVTLLGMLTGPWILQRFPSWMNIRPLEFLGRHALKIYLLHQAVLYALFSLIKLIRQA